jgi:hypothetical protein
MDVGTLILQPRERAKVISDADISAGYAAEQCVDGNLRQPPTPERRAVVPARAVDRFDRRSSSQPPLNQAGPRQSLSIGIEQK